MPKFSASERFLQRLEAEGNSHWKRCINALNGHYETCILRGLLARKLALTSVGAGL